MKQLNIYSLRTTLKLVCWKMRVISKICKILVDTPHSELLQTAPNVRLQQLLLRFLHAVSYNSLVIVFQTGGEPSGYVTATSSDRWRLFISQQS